MKKFILSYATCFLCICNICAQSSAIDKLKVMEYLQNQQFEEAINYLAPLIVNDSANQQVLGLLGYAHYMNDNIPEAKKYYEKIIAVDSNNISANQYLAAISNGNNLAAAKAYTQRLITLQPNKALYYRNMGDLLKRTNEKDSALIYYMHAYKRLPGDFRNAAGVADILIDKKNYSVADSIVETALAKDSSNIPCLKLRIRSAYEAKNYQQTILPGERLMRLGDVSLGALTQLALSFYNLKLYSDCIRVCDYMLQNQLEIESIYYYEARSYAKLKDFAKSNELLQTCLTKAISKTAEMYYYNLGENYEATHQFTEAVKQYDSAYYLFKDPLMKYYAGRIYETNLNNEKLAGKYYKQYLQFAKPESADEKKAYQYVKTRWGKKRKSPVK